MKGRFWNNRGINKPATQGDLKSLIEAADLDFLVFHFLSLVETKFEVNKNLKYNMGL